MKRTMKLLLVAVVMAVLCTFVAISASAETTENGLKYSVSNNEVTIKGCYGNPIELIIPAEIEGYPVTSIGFQAFCECTSLTSVTIPDSVMSIEDYAFSDCTSLTSVTIPDSVTSIGDYTFDGCNRLKSVTFGENSQLTSIGHRAFYNCYSLASVTFGENSQLSIIGDSVFDTCDSLINITIPDSVTSIGDYAFLNCASLTEITILNPDCTIYDSTYTIYSAAVIRGYDNSTAQAYAEKYDRIFVSLDGEATDILLSGYAGEKADFTITRDGKMTITGSGKMYDYGSSDHPWHNYSRFIKSVSIEDTITSIGSYAFYNCIKLVNITIPDSVTNIGQSAFENCDSLVNITIPDSVTSINSSAFLNCTSLVNITIPGSVAGINVNAFYNCDSLESITILNPKCYIDNYGSTISDTAVIYGYANSTAQSYARKYNRTFVALECDHANATFVPGTAATCTKDGKTDGTICHVCNNTTGSEVIPATGHAYSSQITKQPTHEATGTEVFTCANCGDTYTETLPKLTDHAYNAVVTAPTCTEQGYTTYTCICGDTYIGDYTDANGHTDEVVPGYEAKCEATGLTDGAVCAVCGVTTLEQEVIPALDHSYITVGAYPATCTSTGFTGITYCSACSTVANYGESTPVAEHKMSDWIISVPATCTESGKKIKTCACGLTEEEVIPATGHKMSDWIVTSEATCTANGKKIKMCACGLTEEEVIPATGHSDADNDGICENCLLNLNPTTEQPSETTNPFQVLIDFLNSLLEWFKKLFAFFG